MNPEQVTRHPGADAQNAAADRLIIARVEMSNQRQGQRKIIKK